MGAAARGVTSRRRPRRPRRRVGGIPIAAIAVAFAIGSALAPAWWSSRTAAISLLPVADTLTMTHDRVAVVPPPGVLGNDIGLGGGAIAVLDTPPSHGTVDLRPDGGYTYTPSAGYVGADRFWYHPTGLLVITTSVTITITNAAPVDRDDSYTAVTGVTLSVAAPGVLANDTDADGDLLSASLVDGGGNGSLSLSTNGGFTFKSGGSFVGLRTFTYRVSDGVATSGIATVSIDVRPQSATPPPPTPTPRPTPTPAPSLLPGPSGLPTPPVVPIPSAAPPGSGGPTSSAATSGAPAGGGSIGGDPPTQPGGLGGGRGRAGGFVVGRGELGPIDGLGDVGIVGIGGLIMWAVPTLVLSVPGLLLLLAVLAQAAGGMLWLPVARRWLGGFGLRRRRRTDRSSA